MVGKVEGTTRALTGRGALAQYGVLTKVTQLGRIKALV